MLEDNNITWPEGVYCEDKLFTIEAIYYSNGVVSIPDCYYYYYRNPNSTVNSRKMHHKDKLIADKEQAHRDVLQFLKDQKADIKDKQFWAITWYYPSNKIRLIIKKESFRTVKYYLFGIIKILEKPI